VTVSAAQTSTWVDNPGIESTVQQIGTAQRNLRSEAATLGSNLIILENRENFTRQFISTLKQGADQLVLADLNEEGANLLALQTRQQLSSTALSLASQADQAVLRLFG
jgi:flagellin-like hook-associated protein FlgL